jgi:cell division protein FtsB
MTFQVVSESTSQEDVEECQKKTKETPKQEGEKIAAPPPPTQLSFLQVIFSPTAILQMLSTSIAFFFYLFSSIKETFSNFYLLTSEQEEIMRQTPLVQKELQAEMDKASTDQKQIGRDIDNLKERLARLEERKRQRLEVMKALNHTTRID